MNLTIREYTFFVLSLLAAVWFFVVYPTQDPRNIVELPVDAESIEQKAISHLEALGYSTPQFRIETVFGANEELLDSLQSEMGRPEMIGYFRKNNVTNLEPYYWEVSFRKKASDENEVVIQSDSDDEDDPINGGVDVIQLRFNSDGEFLELVNNDYVFPLKTVSREVIAAAFSAPEDSAMALLSAFSDSTLIQQLFINIPRSYEEINQDNRLRRLEELLGQGRHYMLSGRDMLKMAVHYLEKSGWESSELSADTVIMGRVNGKNFASAQFKLKEPKLGQQLSLNVKITPTGSLLGITGEYNINGGTGKTFYELWPLIRNALIFLFCLAGVIIFFYRIRARVIDTKPALVIAILGGIAVSIQIVLNSFSDPSLSGPDGGIVITLFLVFAGVGGALTCLLYFIFFAIGDSIIRQHWPQKLNTYDYLRQGMIFNQPVGAMLIRSIMLAFILAGLWTLLLSLFPGLYIDVQNVFLQEHSLWPPLYLLIISLLFSLSLVLGVFLVIGGQTFAQTKSKLAASAAMIGACIIVVPVSGSYGPVFIELLAGGLLGLCLTLIYLKWDFLTLFVSHFLFLGLIETSSAWMIEGSPDTYVLISFLLLVAFLLVSGLLAFFRGTEEKGLSHFVPEYVEELAQEERIKQELQIAREVQQSFLPVRTPDLPQLELSAVCKPAYETGGDYYDFIPLDEIRIAVTIGDVSGKGIQAAFYMTFVKGIIHSLCREIDSPAELLKKANHLFCENAPRGTFISLVYGIVDLEKNLFHFARAGHNPILRINARTGSIEELRPKGIGIGLTKDTSFDNSIEEIELELCTEDILILYTDGIVEALNEKHKFYGSRRLNRFLKKNKEKTAVEMLNQLMQDVRTYIGNAKQHDDMTMMVMKLKKG